jgi:putative transposase
MRDWQSQAHVKHYCRYHIVFVPKYRRKAIYGTLRNEIGRIFRELCRQGGLELVEGYAMRDHIWQAQDLWSTHPVRDFGC